jgi:predicted DCC family thiol-disulfide oxidoreductase YuxK
MGFHPCASAFESVAKCFALCPLWLVLWCLQVSPRVWARELFVFCYDANMSQEPWIVLFDGTCSLCNGSVRFIMKHDRRRRFSFASSQTEFGRELARRHGFAGPTPGSIVLLVGERCYSRSTASLEIARRLDGFWRVFYAMILIPRPLRDSVYKFVAARRHRWFGPAKECVAIPEAQRADK